MKFNLKLKIKKFRSRCEKVNGKLYLYRIANSALRVVFSGPYI